MAIDAVSKVLHYWSSRYGNVPIVGGDPVHTRNGPGTWTDKTGKLRTAIVNTPRSEQWSDVLIGGERRQVLTLEQARTTSLLDRNDLTTASWTKTNVTVASGKFDPAGGLNAFTVTATAATGSISQSLAAGSSIKRTNAVWLRRRTGTGTINVQDQDGNNGFTAVLTDSWQRFKVTTGAASTGRVFGIRIVTNGDAVDVYLPQQDDAESTSSTIASGSAATTRAIDQFYWGFTSIVQAMVIYIRLVPRDATTGWRFWQIGSAVGNATPYLMTDTTGAGDVRFYHDEGGGGSVTGSVALGFASGDVVEACSTIYGDGHLDVCACKNAGVPSSPAPTGALALPSAWAGQALWLNSIFTLVPGLAEYAELKIVKQSAPAAANQIDLMTEMRAFEMNEAGEIIVTGS